MKTFKNLQFYPHPSGNGVQAKMNFENGYGVSVIRFDGSFGFHEGLWEVAILHRGSLTYKTDITDDVLGYQTEKNVTEIMKRVQKLKEQE